MLSGIDEMKELNRGLPVHHIDYDTENNQENNLITLCCSCNAKVNSNREDWTKFFQKKLRLVEVVLV